MQGCATSLPKTGSIIGNVPCAATWLHGWIPVRPSRHPHTGVLWILYFPIDLATLIQTVGYLGIFLIVFADSGVLLGLVLPGDSLLFTAACWHPKAISTSGY